MAELNFNWRLKDYALEACPKRLVRFSDDESNVTINFVKYYQSQGKKYKYSIGYFWYNDREPCWELKFVGNRFKDIREEDSVIVLRMLKAAYDTLEEWSKDNECFD